MSTNLDITSLMPFSAHWSLKVLRHPCIVTSLPIISTRSMRGVSLAMLPPPPVSHLNTKLSSSSIDFKSLMVWSDRGAQWGNGLPSCQHSGDTSHTRRSKSISSHPAFVNSRTWLAVKILKECTCQIGYLVAFGRQAEARLETELRSAELCEFFPSMANRTQVVHASAQDSLFLGIPHE